MFTEKEIELIDMLSTSYALGCFEKVILTDIKEKMKQVNELPASAEYNNLVVQAINNRQKENTGGNMFTKQEELIFLRSLGSTMSKNDQKMIEEIIFDLDKTDKDILPQVLITLPKNEGAISVTASRNMVVVIEEEEMLMKGGQLEYPEVTIADDFNEHLNEAELRTRKYSAIKIFIHDAEDLYPYNLKVGEELVGQYESIAEAVVALNLYLEGKLDD